MKRNEGRSLLALDRPTEAAVAFRELLDYDPTDRAVTLQLLVLYQDSLYEHQAALELADAWLEQHPDDVGMSLSALEAHFAAGRSHHETVVRSRQISEQLVQESSSLLVARGYEVAARIVEDAQDGAKALAALRELVSTWPEDFRPTWGYSGTRHFVTTTPDLPYRTALSRLFAALEAPGRDLILQGLELVAQDLDQSPEEP